MSAPPPLLSGIRACVFDAYGTLFDVSAARSAYASLLRISCNGQADAIKLRELLAPYCQRAQRQEDGRGCPVQIDYRNTSARVELSLGDSWRVELRDELLAGLRTWLSDENVKILYH